MSENTTGFEPSIGSRSQPNPQASGNEPALAIDAALFDLLVTLNSNNPLEREAAIELFAEMGERALPALLRGLRANNRVAQLGAVRAIQLIGDTVMIPHLVGAMGEDPWLDWALLRAVLSLGRDGEEALITSFERGSGLALARQFCDKPLEANIRRLEYKLLRKYERDLQQLLKLYRFRPGNSELQSAIVALGHAAAEALLQSFYNEHFTPWETSVLMLRTILNVQNEALCHQVINAIHRFYAQRRTLKNASNVEYWLWQVEYQHENTSVRTHAGQVRRQLRQTIHKGLRA